MKKILNYFSLSHAERNGFFVLVIFILLILIVPRIFLSVHKTNNPLYTLIELPEEDFSEDLGTNKALCETYPKNNKIVNKREQSIEYFFFNPNNLPASYWSALGLSAKQISVIQNYESKGGRFYKKEDLAKIYSLTEKDYERLAPYIVIPERSPKLVASEPQKINVSHNVVIDLNLADTAMLKKLKGIGSSYSKRIVNYRNALGGFYSLEQLREVYGMNEELFEQIRPHLKIEAFTLQKININTAPIEVLKKHPYISNKEAQLIVNYKKQHGDYHSIDDLKKIIALHGDFFIKIEPYLSF